MCSIGEDDFGDDGGEHAMVQELDAVHLNGQSEEQSQVCKKCDQEEAIVKLIHKDPLCKNCFMNYVRHKFRATLGSTKIVKKNSNVLLITNGGPESLAMLDMVKFGVEDSNFKKLYVTIVGVLYIDDSFLFVENMNERQERLKLIQNKLEYLNMPLLYATLTDSSAIVRPLAQAVLSEDVDPAEERIKLYIQKLKSLTSKQDYLAHLKNHVVISAAKQLETFYIFTSEISTDMAKKLLTNISLGRGASVALDVGFCDDRHADVTIIRPMRDLNPAEIDYYMKLNAIEPVSVFQYGSDLGHDKSIQNLTSNFIDQLQTQFPATVSTVFKTGDRLKGKQTVNKIKKCKMCLSSLDLENAETLFATEYSRIVSEHANQHISDPEFIEQKAKEAVDDVQGLKQDLCHGCRNIFIGVSDTELLLFDS